MLLPEWRLGTTPPGARWWWTRRPGLARVLPGAGDQALWTRATARSSSTRWTLSTWSPKRRGHKASRRVDGVADPREIKPPTRRASSSTAGSKSCPQVHPLAWAVAAESLFRAGRAARNTARCPRPTVTGCWPVAQMPRRIPRCRSFAIDYVPPRQRDLARETAKQIRALGIIPVGRQPGAGHAGRGPGRSCCRARCWPSTSQSGHAANLATPLHRWDTMPLNHLGLDARLCT